MYPNKTIPVMLAILSGFLWMTLSVGAATLEPQLPAGPVTLQECVRLALANNPSLTASRQRIVTAQAGLERARSGYQPQLSLSLQEGLTSDTSFLSVGGNTVNFTDSDTVEELNLNARQSIWLRGRKENVRLNRAAVKAATGTHEAATQNLVEAVARDYYAALASQRLLEVAEASVHSAEDHQKEVQARISVGEAAQSEVYSAEDDIARAQLAQIDTRSVYRQSLAQLKNTLGVPATAPLELAQSQPDIETAVPTLEDALKTACASRPDIAAAGAVVEQNRYNVALAKINRGPAVEVFGEYNQGYTEWNSRDATWLVLMALAWPLFDGGATRADVKAARAGQSQAEADLQIAINQAGLEVENALIEVDRTKQRLQATARSVTAAEARLKAAEVKYREGMAIFLEVSDALSALTDARASQVQAKYDAEMASVRLQRAMGLLEAEKLIQ